MTVGFMYFYVFQGDVINPGCGFSNRFPVKSIRFPENHVYRNDPVNLSVFTDIFSGRFVSDVFVEDPAYTPASVPFKHIEKREPLSVPEGIFQTMRILR
jgi:hypothetical protein